MDMADMAAGIVFKRLVVVMSKHVDCEVICPRIDDVVYRTSTIFETRRYKRLPYRVEKFLEKLMGFKVMDYVWSIITYKQFIKQLKGKDYNAVLSFVYGGNDAPIILGKKIAETLNKPWGIYSVDAIPVPLPWRADENFREKRVEFLGKYISKSDAYYASNPIMLDYEMSLYPDFNGKSAFILTPCNFSSEEEIKDEPHQGTIFLYAGYLYGPRNVSALLRGFELFSAKQKNVKLVFVGNNSDSHFVGYEHLLTTGIVERHGYTRDIAQFYNRADVLIDLNADVENDVFLSSKVCNYLSYDKPIITISQDGSPVRALMSGYQSIIHAHHNAEEIEKAMKGALEIKNNRLNDRDTLKEMFMPEKVAELFCGELAEL